MAARYFRHVADTEPMVVVSCLIGVLGVTTVAVAPRVRLALGMPTDQYFGLEDPSGRAGDVIQVAGPRPVWVKNELGVKPELVSGGK